MHRSKSVRGVDKAGKVLSLHPLQVEMVISNGEDKVFMTFNCLVVLGVVTVNITHTHTHHRGQGVGSQPQHSSPTFTLESLAWSLPTPQKRWQLAAAGLTDSWDKLLPDKLPYMWAQRLAGLNFLSVKPSKDP